MSTFSLKLVGMKPVPNTPVSFGFTHQNREGAAVVTHLDHGQRETSRFALDSPEQSNRHLNPCP